ncbi:MAG: zinc ABC transporter substrate-binding protein [Actinomycetota bacterium]|nr:zinc ABC transporter substrate-binding protein [Actinomycetota bacterium]
MINRTGSVMTFRIPDRGAVGTAVLCTAVLTTAVLALAGCGSGDSGAGQGGEDAALSVVATTDVWGSVVETVAGDTVEVTTLVDDPSADPHSYESTPADAAAVTDADLVVFNGGGYDEFVAEILGSLDAKRTVHAFELAEGGEGHAHEGGANEHVWYELPAVQAVAAQVAEELGTLLPEQAETFTANAAAFREEIGTIAAQLSAIGQVNPGARVALTEPIASYLIEDAGLTDVTPAEFLEAVEEETDPRAAAVAATRQLMSGNQVSALIYNPQTETPVTEQVRSDAEAAGVPVVEMTETLPEGVAYVSWMTEQVEALSSALAR